MRIGVIVFLLIAVTMLVFGAVTSVGAPQPAAAQGCTETGTSSRNIMVGTPRHDVLCARGGRDYVAAGNGPDTLLGDGGSDTMVGGSGVDRLEGASGKDRLFGVDRKPGDLMIGGPGRDRCYGDKGDRFRSCERKFISHDAATAIALSAAFLGQGSLAVEQVTTTTTAPPPPAVTITQTITVSFPPCQPPPNIPPHPC